MRSPSLKPTRLPPSFARDSISTFTIFILPLFVLALIALYNELSPSLSSSSTTTTSEGKKILVGGMANHNALNVFKKPLAVFSKEPLTGFYRDGYCRVGVEDGGNHAVAGKSSPPSLLPSIRFWLMNEWYGVSGVLTKEFLDFSASRGNNLRSIGLEPGCKWCLCTARWKEAVDAAKGPDDPIVPKVHLHCTDQSALQNGVSMDVLKKFSAEPEVQGSGGRLYQEPKTPETPGGIARETH